MQRIFIGAINVRMHSHVAMCTLYPYRNGTHSIMLWALMCLSVWMPVYQVLNLVCLGTCFQLTEIVREGDGLPSSTRCLEAIQRRWTCWAGLPTVLRCDRGLHNRGVLAQFCAAHGIQLSHAPLETPEAIGRVERHGGAL